jgi:capsular exopolysaccharide synthesis family protein
VLVEGNSAAEGWLQETGVNGLQIVTSGPLPPNPSELLGSQRMQDLVARLEGQADLVLFDSPPVVAVTDAAVLAKEVDGALLVVDAGKTRRGPAEQARAALEQVGAGVLGVVLNKVNYGQGSYYYYYSGYGADGGKDKRSRRRGLAGRWDRVRAGKKRQ